MRKMLRCFIFLLLAGLLPASISVARLPEQPQPVVPVPQPALQSLTPSLKLKAMLANISAAPDANGNVTADVVQQIQAANLSANFTGTPFMTNLQVGSRQAAGRYQDFMALSHYSVQAAYNRFRAANYNDDVIARGLLQTIHSYIDN